VGGAAVVQSEMSGQNRGFDARETGAYYLLMLSAWLCHRPRPHFVSMASLLRGYIDAMRFRIDLPIQQ
jgi:hypothetical protein